MGITSKVASFWAFVKRVVHLSAPYFHSEKKWQARGMFLAIVALKKSKVLRGIGRGAAVTGLVTSLVGLMLATAMSVYVVNRISKCSDYEIGSTSWSDCIYQQQQ